MSILLLGGSPAATSSGARLLQHIGDKLALHGHRTSSLHVKDLPAHALLQADLQDPAIERAVAQVRDAQAIVIVTPVYKASYTGLLKAFLDLLPQDGLDGKLVLPLATGGSQSHMLVLDYALRPVLASLSPRGILPGIYATSAQLLWHAETGLTLDAPIAERVARGVEQLSTELLVLLRARERDAAPEASSVAA